MVLDAVLMGRVVVALFFVSGAARFGPVARSGEPCQNGAGQNGESHAASSPPKCLTVAAFGVQSQGIARGVRRGRAESKPWDLIRFIPAWESEPFSTGAHLSWPDVRRRPALAGTARLAGRLVAGTSAGVTPAAGPLPKENAPHDADASRPQGRDHRRDALRGRTRGPRCRPGPRRGRARPD